MGMLSKGMERLARFHADRPALEKGGKVKTMSRAVVGETLGEIVVSAVDCMMHKCIRSGKGRLRCRKAY